MSFMQLISALDPDPVSIGLAALAVLQAVALGLVLDRREEDPSLAFASGMGLIVAVYTAVGVVTPLDFRVVAAALAVAGCAGAAWARRRQGDLVKVLGVAFVLSLPLLIVVSGRIASEWDEFSHWLHAFRYVAVNHGLPGGPEAAPIASCCAAYPYGWAMMGYPALLVRFTESIPALMNTLLLALFGLTLARLAAKDGVRPGWGLIAAGIVATTLASPTFVPKLAFSSYADVITGFLVGVLVIAGERLVSRVRENADLVRPVLLFGLTAAAILSVKPGNLALLGCVAAGTGLLILRLRVWRGVPVLAVALVPAIIVHLLWRWHVGQTLAGQEMAVRAIADWNLHALPRILAGMLQVASNKGGFFALAVIVVGLAVWALGRPESRFARLSIVAGVLVLGYNVFLAFTYVAVFGLPDALRVASYWRYNTHLGFAVLVPTALGLRLLWDRFGAARWGRWLVPAAIAVVLVGPVATLKHIRFDVDPMKSYLRQTLREVARIVPPSDTAAILDPQGSGLVGVVATYEWNGTPRYGGVRAAFDSIPVAEWLALRQTPWVWVVSGRESIPEIPAGAHSALVRRSAAGNEVLKTWPFPDGKEPKQYP